MMILHSRLQAILINRLILNLRSYDQSSNQSFSTILGNIGEPLRTAEDDHADEFDENFGQSENPDLSEHAEPSGEEC